MSPAQVALRKLSGPEVKAAELTARGLGKRSIIIQTGLSEQQIDNAVALKAELDRVQAANQRKAQMEAERAQARAAAKAARQQEPEADVQPEAASEVEQEVVPDETSSEDVASAEPVDADGPAPAEPVDEQSVIEPEPVPVVDEQAAIEQLLTRAEGSLQPRVREIAAAVRTQLAHLVALLDNDERVRILTASIEVMRRNLDKDERELAELLGDAGAVPDARAVVDWDAELADGPKEAPPVHTPTDAELSYDPNVRSWAKAEGWEVSDTGRMKGAIVAAYRNAHPTGGAL